MLPLHHQTLKVMNKKLSEDELRWRAEEDARTLGRYQEIINDKDRLNRALKVAEKQADDLTERASALRKSITGVKKSKK